MSDYMYIQRRRAPDDQSRIIVYGTFLSGQAKEWHNGRKRVLAASRLEDNWNTYSTEMVARFADKQEKSRDHDKILSLQYQGNFQTYLARLNELNSQVNMTGETLHHVVLGHVGTEILEVSI